MSSSFSHSVNTDQATFLGFAFEAIAYGTYIVLFGISIAVLMRRTPAMNTSKIPMFTITCFMFSLCTVHFSLNFNNVYDGLMVHPRPHISEETPLLAGADLIFSIADFCSQLILINRCYLVWGKAIWVVILPILISFASVACTIGVGGVVLSTNPTATQAPAAVVPLGTAGYAMSLCLNLMVSALIVGRIWYLSRRSQREGITDPDSAIQKAMGIVVESGLLFLAAQFVFVVLFAIAHPAQATVEPVATQIYGISPTLIIVRVGMGASYEQTTAPGSSLRFGVFSKKAEISQITYTTSDDSERASNC
ncbi:hypothetical protein B0H10DRAFT_1771350 [Mycena sp. CBHHK59/15]|nr:hypothetical protein B0H10DRAFT_1771350 [Mycena sp. CBHHK59/15]